jgi:hypothetical protein
LTSPVFFLGEHFLEALKWLASNRLHTMEGVHNVGLHMGMLGGPTKALKLLSSRFDNTFEDKMSSLKGKKEGLTC